VIEVDKRVSRPKAVAQFLASDDFAGFFEKQSQNLKGLVLQLDLQAMLAELPGAQVEFEARKAQRMTVRSSVVRGHVRVRRLRFWAV
jgi:hypothetical protein